MWTQGAIGIPSGNCGMTSVSYWVKHYENESQFGIDNGRISKLTLVQNSKVVYNYDRGEDIAPQTSEAETALAILLKEYN